MEKILISSDSSLCVEFGSSISEEINQRVNAFAKLLEKENVPGVTELVPTYRSVTVHYRPEQISYARLRTVLEELSHRNVAVVQELQPEIVIPVLYGGTCGPDLPRVAALHGLTEEEVVQLHTAPSYLIYMMGFLPGFCYLGGLDKRIATSRLEVPRVKIPAGSVGIAGEQTGIYPLDSPGGWQLIGRTPLKLYDPQRPEPILLRAGMRLRYKAIGRQEFECLWCQEHPDEPLPGKEADR